MKTVDFETLLGKTLKSVVGDVRDKELIFETVDGERYKLYHDQECCESVQVEDICGDLQDLVGSPILQAEEVTNEPEPGGKPSKDYDSWTWTFYRIATVKGQVVIRWLGESNGYYSESVDFVKLK